MGQLSLLDNQVLSLLKSETIITSVPIAIKEIIENSIDSQSTKIEAIVDLDNFSFIIKDNGSGINPDDLNLICSKRFLTSKLTSNDINDMKSLKTFGFRGESLFSISKITESFHIISKTQEYNSIFIKSINNHNPVIENVKMFNHLNLTNIKFLNKLYKNQYQIPINLDLKTSGTIVIVNNLFFNLPVRQSQLSRLSLLKVLDQIRLSILQISVLNPNVQLKIKLYPNFLITKAILPPLYSASCSNGAPNLLDNSTNMIQILNSVYGISIKNNYEFLSTESKSYKLSGIISTIPSQSKKYQFIFINNRRIDSNNQLFNTINQVFKSSDFGYNSFQYLQPYFNSSSLKQLSPQKIKSPYKYYKKTLNSITKPFSRYPVFIIKIECENSISDLIQDPSKLIYNSAHFKSINPIILKLLKTFLSEHGFTLNSNKSNNEKGNEKNIGGTTSKSSSINNTDSNRINLKRKFEDTLDINFKNTKDNISNIDDYNDENINLEQNDTTKHIKLLNQKVNKKSASLFLNSKIKTGRINIKEINGRWDNSNPNNSLFLRPFLSKFEFGFKGNDKLINNCYGESKSSLVEIMKKSKCHKKSHHCFDDYGNDNSILKINYKTAYTSEFFDNKIGRNEINLKNFKLSREDIAKLKVISQVDNKFILTTLNSSILLIVDQHACDERIKVEEIFCDFVERMNDKDFEMSIKLKEELRIEVCIDESDLLLNYLDEFNIWGFNFSIESGEDNSVNKVIITHLPYTLIERSNYKDGEFIKRCLIQHGYDLSENRKFFRKDKKDNNHEWLNELRYIPKVIIECLNSKACRGSVMFGDKLLVEECEILINKLGYCKLPFQCAHGRPTIVPIAYLGESRGNTQNTNNDENGGGDYLVVDDIYGKISLL
ncbi:mismatch repair protein MLH3 ASCRUDRAFT_83265 [Ascoidea rubescens DSM 1968]|uniref:MutL C-terminal dimerisation domain-containing protein n=1 Tax=Ascoidea rubescens DSM 1968 TaxID=1344418 RepID=A0A1D2VNW3_9ASCO|nr:hypothetical protein ASCRUDRAFT_83265 [Ascoidea rubescens DSM 1968]ODV63289.1 hypothetical protein ASCRUDRAFT_83265 [Ascoidea rubescens DSM 1968]